MDTLKRKNSHSILGSKYGSPVAGRIFEVLLSNGQLEETQVVDFATSPKQEVRTLLYKMLKDGFVSIQSVPRTSDRLPARSLYLWKVNRKAVYDRMLDSFYLSWANIKRRMESEHANIKPLFDKLKIQEAITVDEKKLIDQYHLTSARGERTLLRLDELILLFTVY